jgi:hypothetical protein
MLVLVSMQYTIFFQLLDASAIHFKHPKPGVIQKEIYCSDSCLPGRKRIMRQNLSRPLLKINHHQHSLDCLGYFSYRDQKLDMLGYKHHF